MDVLIVISTTAAWLYGLVLSLIGYSESEMRDVKAYTLMIHSHVHNWETSSVLILIVVLGKYIEAYSKMKTVAQLSRLAELKVTKAYLVRDTDQQKLSLSAKTSEVPVELLEVKDFVMVSPGGAVPTDGVVVLGRGMCNESMLTGES